MHTGVSHSRILNGAPLKSTRCVSSVPAGSSNLVLARSADQWNPALKVCDPCPQLFR